MTFRANWICRSDSNRVAVNLPKFPVQTPFREQDLFGGKGRIELEILGDDAWLPDSLYVFGLDTPDGRPTKLVPLVSKRVWGGLVLSRDPNEGIPKITL